MDDVMCIDASRFSKQRQLVMGIAAFMIYFARAYAIVPVDGVIAKLFSFGNLGVDIFLFASGFGRRIVKLSATSSGRPRWPS